MKSISAAEERTSLLAGGGGEGMEEPSVLLALRPACQDFKLVELRRRLRGSLVAE